MYNYTWRNGNKTNLLKLQRVVNKFICLTFNLDYRSSVKEVMLKKLSVNHRSTNAVRNYQFYV